MALDGVELVIGALRLDEIDTVIADRKFGAAGQASTAAVRERQIATTFGTGQNSDDTIKPTFPFRRFPFGVRQKSHGFHSFRGSTLLR